MSNKEKLNQACELLRIAIQKQAQPCIDVSKKWVAMSLTSSHKKNRGKYDSNN